MSYYYLIEVDPHSPLDMDIQRKVAAAVHGQGSRGYRDYYRVTADSVPEAVGRILINDRLLTQRQADLSGIGEPK
ncbi:hypothetical protein MICAF_40018 [Microcystis aeruginosa PCC 9807]|uniref:Uncharacterized protein n=1 Tax=Microcystis aeruginosa PCC 9807 TaxID=1160283 RepID=I4H911_MICAE|nr:hypothetical protein [Microcystis aeruginosa]CCI18535.1 hypothetical protein MICAF_40018 [Microcystis aeruginosa PCC 9807]